MSNILKHELKNNYVSLLIWTSSAIVIMLVFALMFPTFETQAGAFADLLKTYPKGFIETLGININTFITPIGFYSFTCLYTMLILSIYAINVSLHIFSYEKTHKINEYLLSKPISRSSVFIAKLLISFILVNLAFVIYHLATVIVFNFLTTADINNQDLLTVNITIYLCMMFFYAVGVILANIIPRIKFVSVYAMGIVFIFYFLTILHNVLDLEAMKYLSPFSVYNINSILADGFDVKIVVIEIIVIIALITFSYYNFIKKEIK